MLPLRRIGMNAPRSIALFSLLSVSLCCSGASAKEPESREEALFRKAGLPSDDAGLLAYLKGRSLAADDAEQIDKLVRQLGSRKFIERQRASTHLIAAGAAALPAL